MSSPEDKSNKTFWQTIPGIITSIAALITAIGGCIAVVFGIPAISNAVFGVTPTPIISETTSSPAVNIPTPIQALTQTPYPTFTPFPTDVPQTVVDYSSLTPIVLASTPSPITTSNCSLSIGQKVNLRKDVRYWTKPNVLEAQFSPAPSGISVYILSGPIWGRIRIDIDYSGWWWEVSASEKGTSLGWVWEIGFEECN